MQVVHHVQGRYTLGVGKYQTAWAVTVRIFTLFGFRYSPVARTEGGNRTWTLLFGVMWPSSC